jgi:L-asparaginase / beta-aspartyl-peptidase
MSEPRGLRPRPVIAVHGGAGVPAPERLAPEQRAAVRAGLHAALAAGRACLGQGGSAVDAVVAAVAVLEDDPAFNAGIGAALTRDGFAEHDAAVMCGASRRAGACTGTRRVRHPVQLARTLLDEGPHVFVAGASAEALARERGLDFVDPEVFVTPRRLAALIEARGVAEPALSEEARHGTVGAVALDAAGHLAAATSTGGLTNKLPGRIGDSPIPGAGTYADDAVCAVSATGRGEYFLRTVFAHRVACLVELGRLGLAEATARALDEVAALGGSGGALVLGSDGLPVFRFNSHGLYRGHWPLAAETPTLAIYQDPET